MEFIVIAILGIFGAGMIAGGIFLYRNSTKTNPRAVGVASIAAGVVMWGLILLGYAAGMLPTKRFGKSRIFSDIFTKKD